ncbi:benzyl alcohol O-benzoyltransferase-like [Prosopis cineraria]|uniref:benzyl alcohol O-benzoyltransferase-like n=1 Tax=Prosopis cineraria TaxID=364024 RepID=UPI00240F2856|nr:benzyl alcohol O-benzoyltransferase-like [Prosopis cineraria]
MAKQSALDLVFNVRRQKPELISPAKPTPHEVKFLSNIDCQEFLRTQIPCIHFSSHKSSMAGKDPAKVIRDALANALVFYYPLAGRLREGEGGKIVVECNGEGAMFIEADADITLQQFGDDLQPPFPCFEDLLYSPPGSDKILYCPILLIQVTRLKCGGFICGIRVNHIICDGYGFLLFMKTLSEMANGATEPLILPVWHRELLNARDPPNITCKHHEYDEVIDATNSSTNIVHRSFFFGPTEVSSLRRLLPDHLRQSSSSFEVITACLWRCRAKALQVDPHKEVRIMVVVNGHFRRNGLNPPLLPKGYYGNAIVFPTAISTIGKLCESPLGYALELVRKAKAEVNDEYFHSAADLIATRGPTCSWTMLSCMVSDLSSLRFRDVDFGWGKAVYAGPAKSGLDTFQGLIFYVGHANSKGEEGRIVPVCLPPECMERFAKELDLILNGVQWQIQESTSVKSKI